MSNLLAIQVLNVDDHADIRELRSEILRSRGYTVIEASNGQDALRLAISTCPEVVLLDVNLPDLSGIEVCRRIKGHAPCEHTVIILVSATELATGVVLDGFAAGADMYLRDHLEAAVLAGFIDAAIRRRQATVEIQHDRAQAQLELSETARRYRSMFDHAPYGICHALEDGTVLDTNRVFADLLGCATPDAARAVNMYELWDDPESRDRAFGRWRVKGTEKDELEWRLPGGQRVHVSVSGRVLERNAEVFEIFVEDITERKRLEADFHHKRKMEAIGRLAGGIAHDLNNWLTVIIGYAEILLEDAPEPIMRERLLEILSASRAATGVTRNLLTFSRKQIVQPQTIELNRVVCDFHQLVARIIGEHIQVEVEIAGDHLWTKADPTQIQQVLMNLAVNARDAMPHGGRLTVCTSHVTLEENSLAYKHVTPGSYALVAVTDTGVGMSSEVRERLFEPFFTTKEAGKGTGLGMAVVYGIVKQLAGYITVDSKPGVGTTFALYFPITESAPTADSEASGSSAPRPGLERLHVLVVEDEEPVRALTQQILGRAGFDVSTASSAEEALQIFERQPHEIGLVLTDVVMPGMSGPDMLARIREVRPVPALLMSGYPDVRDVVEDGSTLRILSKPFTAEVLIRGIHEALTRASGDATLASN